ncbi:hypothetical protein ACSLGF_06835 [Bacillus sp. A015]
MPSVLIQILSLIKYNTVSLIRKRIFDWNLQKISKKNWIFFFVGLIAIYLTLLSLAVFFGTKALKMPLNTWIQIVLIAIFLDQIIWAINYFKENYLHFLLDLRKHIHQLKHVRITQVLSVFFQKAIFKTIFIWFIFVVPISCLLYIFKQTDIHPVYIFCMGGIHLLLGLLLSMLTSFFIYFITVIWSKGVQLRLVKAIFFSISLLLPLALGYLVFYLTSEESLIEQIKFFITSETFSTLLKYTPYIWMAQYKYHWFILISVLIICMVLTIFMICVWVFVLRKLDLIPYSDLYSNKYKSKFKTADSMRVFHAVFQKDKLFIQRMNGFFIRNFGSMLYLLMLILGFGIPSIKNFFSAYPVVAVMASSVIVANFVYQLVGDALKMVLSVDGELKNQHLFQTNVKSLKQIILPKLCLYNLGVLILSVLLTLVFSLFIGHSIYLIIYIFIVFTTSGFLYGLIQISSTALYPKFNWEHVYEIGESGKAKTYSNVYSAFFFIFSLQITGFSTYLLYNNPKMETVILNVSSLIFFILTLLNYILMLLFLSKIKLSERFASND